MSPMRQIRTGACRTHSRLTVKLTGRPEAPDWSRGCTLSSRTRGDTTDSHGPLQRLLGGMDISQGNKQKQTFNRSEGFLH
jgi:hypothetical protein